MTKYLGELEDDDLVMFTVEHLKDHKGPHKLVEGLEPVRLSPIAVVSSLLNHFLLGLGRGGRRASHFHLATDHFRKHGLRGGLTHGTDDGGLIMLVLTSGAFLFGTWAS